MTLEIFAQTYLEQQGLYPKQADAVVKMVESSLQERIEPGQWLDDASNYTVLFQVRFIVTLDVTAIRWIDANWPKHHKRRQFIGSVGLRNLLNGPANEDVPGVWSSYRGGIRWEAVAK